MLVVFDNILAFRLNLPKCSRGGETKETAGFNGWMDCIISNASLSLFSFFLLFSCCWLSLSLSFVLEAFGCPSILDSAFLFFSFFYPWQLDSPLSLFR